jgi:MbtH protein
MTEEAQEKMKVLVNHEGQYSFWPIWKKIPNGWMDVGFCGSKEECGDYVKNVWTDMRPLSLRNKISSIS